MASQIKDRQIVTKRIFLEHINMFSEQCLAANASAGDDKLWEDLNAQCISKYHILIFTEWLEVMQNVHSLLFIN